MDLVILAAGMGSRFGGNKQIEPIDDDGNFILDYSVFDGVAAGFDRVILIIRKEHHQLFEDTVGKRLRKTIPVEYAFQDIDDVPNKENVPLSRTKPWGTAHALYACRSVLSDKFAVINADDFYGREPFQIVANFLKDSDPSEFVCAGFRIANALSDKGMVKRGIITADGRHVLEINESRVERRNGKIFATPLFEEKWKEISSQTLVSMTMFGLSTKILDEIKKEMKEFFAQDEQTLETAELLLPEVVSNMLSGDATLDVYPTTSQWFGITYREDLEKIKSAVKQMKQDGIYPKHLYGQIF